MNGYAALTSLSAVILIVAGWLIPAPADKVVFLDVGQGDAILLQDETAQVLIDGGPGMAVLRELAREMPWFDRKIEVVVNTHPDRDHLEGLLHVLERYEVGLVLMPEVRHDSQLYAAWLKLLEEKGVPVRFARAGQGLKAGDLEIAVLGPMPDLVSRKTNDASVITRVDFGEMSWLLTGDAEKKVENALAGAYSDVLDADILKAGHHGSNSSTHAVLIQAATPAAAVISVGENSYGHPHPDVLARLAGRHVWRTDEDGSVRFVKVGDQWLLKTRK